MNAEQNRLEQDRLGQQPWKFWGPYLSDRAWGTVREDYSRDGSAWDSFPHDQARSRAYRWNEDGLMGVSDHHGRLCLGLGLWNGRDPILKERLFGLSGTEGNHGEDVKEAYFYLESTPTHSYMKAFYKYPQLEFPYARLIEENAKRGKTDPEFELVDTGIFEGDRYWDIEVEYAKAGPDDVLMRVTAHNRGPEAATLHLLPQLWFRNTWSWTASQESNTIRLETAPNALCADHPELGTYRLYFADGPQVLFCENETNLNKLYGQPNRSSTAKDGINDFVVHGLSGAVNKDAGSKVALWHQVTVGPGESSTVQVRLTKTPSGTVFSDFDSIMETRKLECDAFYAELQPAALSIDERLVQRQAFAGMLFSKQFYHFDVRRWLEGDATQPAPPDARRAARDHDWAHLHAANVLSMPDAWEYPWFAAWDLAFHTIPLALVDPEFAKKQLTHLVHEWYQHPNGQLPAYEWDFSNVNPPVHAWAAWRVYQTERERWGRTDRVFLERVFLKLMLNFTWWVNREDAQGKNVFQGGFLGLDNICVFDRDHPPEGASFEQADGTAWMGLYSLSMLRIALELARENPVYEEVASTLFERFLSIAQSLEGLGDGLGFWDDEDGFFYDALRFTDGNQQRLRVRSVVGLIPLFAVETLEPDELERFPQFKARLEWFLAHRPDLTSLVSHIHQPGVGDRHLLSLVRAERMSRVLTRVLDESEFLSPHGVRSLSKYHLEHPLVVQSGDETYRVDYEPAESTTGLFGGNSNWRGPVWFPINYLLIESLKRFHAYYGDAFTFECPTGSGRFLTLEAIADELSVRLVGLFTTNQAGERPVFGANERTQHDPLWRDLILFHEYFHGESGAGLGASHQTGWTGLVASLAQARGEARAASAQTLSAQSDAAKTPALGAAT